MRLRKTTKGKGEGNTCLAGQDLSCETRLFLWDKTGFCIIKIHWALTKDGMLSLLIKKKGADSTSDYFCLP